jgi:hypothetical protein
MQKGPDRCGGPSGGADRGGRPVLARVKGTTRRTRSPGRGRGQVRRVATTHDPPPDVINPRKSARCRRATCSGVSASQTEILALAVARWQDSDSAAEDDCHEALRAASWGRSAGERAARPSLPPAATP